MPAHGVSTSANSCEWGVYFMSRLMPKKSGERPATNNLDRALSDMLDALRKPQKLTATLKRRALKNKIGGKNVLSEASGRETDRAVKTEGARVAPDLSRF
jgi:hypothetical protein